jgi:Fis family transcriptional regulator
MNATPPSLQECVRANLEAYWANLGDQPPSHLHDMLIRAVEKPLLESVMSKVNGNQSRAAIWLGLNRNTLRKKLLEHGLIS